MWMVTGATGHVGGEAVRVLTEQGHGDKLVGLVRDPGRSMSMPVGTRYRVADYDDRAGLERAFQGVSRLLFVSSDGEARDVLRHHANVIDAAAAACVRSTVFLSILDCAPDSPFYYAPVYADAERQLKRSGVAWTILRCGLYMDFIASHWIEPALVSGVFDAPIQGGEVAPISRDDVAAAAAAALTADGLESQTFQLTGGQALSSDAIAETAGKAFGRPLAYQPRAATDYLLNAWASLSDPWPQAFSTLFTSIRQGRYAYLGDGFHQLTKRKAISWERFLREWRHTYSANRE